MTPEAARTASAITHLMRYNGEDQAELSDLWAKAILTADAWESSL